MNIYEITCTLTYWNTMKYKKYEYMKTPFVIFDRDGTLIENIPYLTDHNLINFKHDLFPALNILKSNGFNFGVITNQSVIGRRIASRETVNLINSKISNYLSSHGIIILFTLICPHNLGDQCDCRKPKPKLGKIAEKFGVDLEKSYFVGDQESDMQFGKKLGCRVVQLNPHLGNSLIADNHSATLTQAAEWIIQDSLEERSNGNTKP